MQRTLTERHVTFPALIIQRGEDDFSALVVDALQRQAPQLPVAVHRIESPLNEDLMAAKAVVIPSSLAVHSPEALRIWLSEYRGKRIFVPQPLDGWTYLGRLPVHRTNWHRTLRACCVNWPRARMRADPLRSTRGSSLPSLR
jgi:hypothetical protein